MFPTGDVYELLGRYCRMIMTKWVHLGPFGIYRHIIYPLNWLNMGWNYDDSKQEKMESILLIGPSTVIQFKVNCIGYLNKLTDSCKKSLM